MRLAEGLARISAGALEKARLLEREQREGERIAFLSRLQKALGRDVTFQTVEIRIFPPAVRLADASVVESA